MLAGWVVLCALGKLREAILVKASVQSIQHCGLRGIRARTGDKDAFASMTVMLIWGHCDFDLMLILCSVKHISPVRSTRARGEG